MAGTDLYWGHGEQALVELAQTLRIPVFLNGLARGCVAADHELFFSRARSQALKGADVALVVGVPMDFRLGFGGAFGEETEIVVIDAAEPEREPSAGGGGGVLRGDRRGRSRTCARRLGRRRWRASAGSPSCARRRPSAARPSGWSSRTGGRRCIRCGCTRSSRRCSSATRS